jgi:hypothetical protein
MKSCSNCTARVSWVRKPRERHASSSYAWNLGTLSFTFSGLQSHYSAKDLKRIAAKASLSVACWGQRTHNVVPILFHLLGQLPSLDDCFITQTLNCFIPSLGLGLLFTCILHLRTGHVGFLFTLISQPSLHATLLWCTYVCIRTIQELT